MGNLTCRAAYCSFVSASFVPGITTTERDINGLGSDAFTVVAMRPCALDGGQQRKQDEDVHNASVRDEECDGVTCAWEPHVI